MTPAPATLPWHVHLAMYLRLFAIQGAWNYETMTGNGIAFALEPALRRLPGGRGGPAYCEAMARQSGYFNAHPYLAAVAVGALARAELDGVPAAQIERFKVAATGPLGSVGDRLIWAGWLPFCSALALLAFGLGASPTTVVALFLGCYNVVHLGLRAWGLRAGWRHGLHVAQALGTPVLRKGPAHVTRATALLAGLALPSAAVGIIGPGRAVLGLVLGGVVAGAAVITSLQGRIAGWRLAIAVLTLFTILSLVR
ncbi:MAG: PTS system mannose/fructose/sorbose family transporter subunit IID [Gemmatimonadota bacterium]|nr:PTS system mannose/fructose/sorbose family transporter subunit IID [Gemmatimonadota bacterium]MDQ8147143.1 PTS system mannose/fructose/sorbose family transporter subunit IID [Gemmatimonadota bacterium]MDQ8149022.1 PTS system mannose/fructose/sorbose family transporter subunit IID [Gemmatimonadota bacterium]MDQ8156475.1 PTS system mannose/fructose/sorbose family transporter subunit IID [Gemmatimonadota bacterium]MDQ8176472.1 PTS system mannose/fructose/sorbose family transporter subunit IID [